MMGKSILVRINSPISSIDASTTVQWGEFTAEGSLIGETHLTAIEQLREAWFADKPKEGEDSLSEDIVLLLGGMSCFYKNVTISAAQKKYLATSVPYIVEEYLAQDIETMHIVNSIPNSELQMSVAGIPHTTLQAILTIFDDYQMPLTRVVAEMQLLVPEHDSIRLMLDEHYVMMALPGREGIAFNYEALPFVFQSQPGTQQQESFDGNLTVENAAHEPSEKVSLMYCADTQVDVTGRLDQTVNLLSGSGWIVDKAPIKSSVFEYFAEQYFVHKSRRMLLDFRQGTYQCPQRTQRIFKRWLPVVAAVGCWFIMELSLSVIEGVIYQYKTKSFWRDSVKQYLTVFPNDRQAIQAQSKGQLSFNVKQVMLHRFRSFETEVSETSFLSMLQTLSIVSGSMKDEVKIDPKSLDFNHATGQLIYEFEVGQIETVNRLLENLNAAGLKGNLDTTNQDDATVITRITLRI